METARLLDHLDAEFAMLRTAVAATDPAAAVPRCPGWTVTDLTRHVGSVYLHKTLAIREGVEREDWPPPEVADEVPLTLLDRSYGDLVHELRTREPAAPTGGWYTPDRTVGFWIRRMAHETVIHRIDAELAAGGAVSPVAADVAVDGCDELLRVFVEFSVREWGAYFTDVLGSSPGRSVALVVRGAAGTGSRGTGWLVRTAPGTFAVADLDPAAAEPADATVSGSPEDLLRWLWNRGGDGATVTGSPGAVAEVRACITVSTR